MAIALPIPGVLLQHAKEPWLKPASAPVSSCRLDHMYRVQQDRTEFLIVHPKPNSLVISSTLKSQKHHSLPSDKEGKKIDAMGRKFYSTGTLGIKAMSYICTLGAIIGRYGRFT